MKREHYEGGRSEKEQAMEKISRYAEVDLEKSGNMPIDPRGFVELYRTDFDPKDVNVSFPGAENRERKALHDMLAATSELNLSFGNAFVRNTSNYDKSRNHVDLVAEYPEGENDSSYLGVEVAGGGDMSRKFADILEGIGRGQLADVKYFHSNETDKKLKLGNIPRVLVAADMDTIYGAGSDLLDGDTTGRDYADHYLHYETLVEAEMQLSAFAKHARKMGRVDIAKTLDEMHAKIAEALNEKIERSGEIPQKDLEKDRAFMQLRDTLALELSRVEKGAS